MTLDHLVWGMPDLEQGIGEFARLTGIEPISGGVHPGRGTRNALVRLGSAYLELIAPDPEQPVPVAGRSFDVHLGTKPGLVAWAWRTEGLDAVRSAAIGQGYDPGAVLTRSRVAASGTIDWSMTPIPPASERLYTPFLIEWTTPRPPYETLPDVAELVALRVEHPRAETVAARWRAIGVTGVALDQASRTALYADIETPRGLIRLGSA